jgi:site-specific recombinase XerD
MSDSLSTGKHFSTPNTQDQSSLFAAEPSTPHSRRKRPSHVTEARAGAQRRKVDSLRAERAQRQSQEDAQPPASLPARKPKQAVSCTWARDAYLQDHIGGNRSPKTIEWHRTALTFFCSFLEQEHQITLVEDIDAIHITSWFAMMRTTPASHGRVRGERTIQTYARSVRAFFHWLQRRRLISFNPFDEVTFPKVGRPLIKTITADEFEKLLWACAPPSENNPLAERAAVRNRAILWVFYDTGVRVSELCGLRLANIDRKHGILTVFGKGSKERRIAMGQNCQRNLFYYLDHYRPDDEELSEWGSIGEDHVFLSETRLPMTRNGVTLLFARLKKRSGITGKRISPHILRHTFAIRYLVSGGDPFSLQELLGHEDLATVKMYMRMNDETIQEQKRKFSPGDHLATRMPGPRQTRRRGFQPRTGGSRPGKA